MSELVLLFERLLEFLGHGGSVALLLGIYALCGVRVVRTGYRGVYFRLGRAVCEVFPGVYWRPVPFYRITILFCGDQVKDLRGQEVVTKGGITCRVEGSISYQVPNLTAMVTTVYDADDQLLWEVMAEIREWVSDHTYEECCAAELGKKIVPAAVRRARKWGIDIKEVNIVTFAPANPEARALVFLLDAVRLRAQSAPILVEAIAGLRERIEELCLNPSVLLASLNGLPMSVVSNAEQFGVLREAVASLAQQIADQKPQPDTLARVGTALADAVPGVGTLLALRKNGDSP